MGSLYLARDPVIDRPIVIKFLKDGFDDPAARERFAREARAAGRLHHPNIVTVFDVGEHENRPFIALEYVAGETLAQLVARRAVRRLWEKLGILEDLCAGLHYAHTAAIVHRDIKPSNVMRDQSGVVKILDFGIARGAGGAITEAGDIVGTLNYMSPEQLAGEEVDHRTDIYSVGVLAYELITDQMAFPGTIQTGVLFKILNSTPLPIESLIPGIDPDIPAVIARATARHPDARYADLETLRQDLDPRDSELNRLLDDMTGSARRTVIDARAAASVRGATATSSAAYREGQSREREANTRTRAGERVPGLRAAWAATALYNKSPEGSGRQSVPVTAAAPPTRESAPPTPGTQTVPASPSPEALNTLPGRANTPPGAPQPPPAGPKPEPPVQTRDTPPDPRAADVAAVRDTLRRYQDAYQSLNLSEVARMVPSLTQGQRRDLERDFANYRRYTVQIKNERINIEGDTATVACEVVRSFEPRTGVAGSHTAQSTFHLRRSGAGWTIERLESR